MPVPGEDKTATGGEVPMENIGHCLETSRLFTDDCFPSKLAQGKKALEAEFY